MNDPSPHPQRTVDELILRDRLALDRTALANERTFLSFIRTGLNFVLVGLSFLYLLHADAAIAAGWVSCAAGGAIIVLGGVRFLRMRSRIRAVGSGA